MKRNISYLLKEGFRNIFVDKLMSVASVGILSCCLILIGASYLLSSNISSLVEYMESRNEIAVFIKDGQSKDVLKNIDNAIRKNVNVLEVTYLDKDAVLEEQKKKISASLLSGFAEDNPFPATYLVKLKNLEKMKDATDLFVALPGVLKVNSPTTYGTFLVKLRQNVNLFGAAVTIVLGVISIVIISNTIRMTVFSRRKEVNIMKFVGATNGFIRMPFIIESLLIAIFSSILSFAVICGLYSRILTSISSVNESWISDAKSALLSFDKVGFVLAIGFILSSAILSMIGTSLSIRKHLRV